MLHRAPSAHRGDPGVAPDPAKKLARDGDPFHFTELLRQVVIVEAGVGGSRQHRHTITNVGRQPPPGRPSPVSVEESLEPSASVPGFQALKLARTQAQGPGSFQVRDLPLERGLDQARPPDFLLAHQDRSPHRGDTFTDPLGDDIIV
jgi:hypothetical protein